MYLKSLELHGFKSFPDRKILKFGNGATIIVGPNGSGKSNITDAMRWVLGELSSKNIRGSKMEDVIFAGANDRKPMSFAEVSVTFDDSEEPRSLQSPYEEVTVTRRYYRSGDSEYYINRKKCRLKDIYELFMNTGVGREGYSIIGQGRIAEIISKKSEERRGVFEESAGISRFRYKKSESEKKLAETEENMNRVGDIERELAMRIGPLEKDAEKARRYLELYGEKKKTDVSLWLYDSSRMRGAIEKSENDTRLSAHELEMAEDSLKVTSAQIDRLYEQSRENKETARRNYDEIAAATKAMNEAESEAGLQEKERIHAETAKESEQALLESAEKSASAEEERLNALNERLKGIRDSCAEAEKDSAILTEKLTVLGGRIGERTDELESLLKEQKTAEDSLTDLRVRLNVLESNISSQQKRSESIAAEIRKYEDEIAGLDKQADDADAQIGEYRKAVEGIDGEIASANAAAAELKAQFADVDSAMRKKQAETDSLDSRITALTRMQEHFDGYNNSIRFVMNEAKAGRLTGIRGPLSYLIRVEEKYIVAIETTLGGALQNIVTDDEEAAKKSIEALKRSSAGRATFYPLTTIRAQERGRDYDGLEQSRGFVGWADELVSCDHEYRNIVRSLLARVAVYDNLDNASNAGRAKSWRIRAVTLDGQQINAGGSFTGGQAKRDSGMLSRAAQIDSLRSERDAVSAELSEIRRQAKDLQEKIAAAAVESRSAEERRSLMEALIGAENKNYSDADGRRRALRELVGNMKNDSLALSESSRDSAGSRKQLEDGIAAAQGSITEIRARREAVAVLRGEDELEAAALTEQSGEKKIRLAELIRDREAALTAASETESRLEGYRSEAQTHRESAAAWEEAIAALTGTTAELRKKAEEAENAIAVLQEKQKKLNDAGDEIDSLLTSLHQTEKEQSGKKELIFIAHSRNETKLASLKGEEQKLAARMWEDYEMTYAAAVKFAEENDCHPIEDGERTSWAARQTELKNKIRGLGHVNVEAVDEYNEVKRRYDYIRNQLNDLRASREDLLKILSGIEEDMKTMFLDAFGKINTYFGEVFRELFGGGHAEVVLTEPDNPLESGIEINAAPPGKTIKNLNLLSGGEQAFIAIALLFALIRVNPSPFCIFDEIEAALDEINVARVARYIRKYSAEMQIIMITHRRGTMEIADTLYGVTMRESGVSDVLTIQAGDNWDELLKE